MSENTKHYWLYVLRLEQGKYYIGITSRKDPYRRVEEHMKGFYSAQWVKKYRPVEPAEIIELGNITPAEAGKLELKRTLQYMDKYGYQNVRGSKLNYSGKYVKIGDRYWRDEDFNMSAGLIFILVTMLALILT